MKINAPTTKSPGQNHKNLYNSAKSSTSMIDIQEKKSKIINFLESSGPSLPVQVARAIQMDPVFASAILSELIGSKTIKTSNMRIGSSPLYLLPGQEKLLEEKTENLKSIEKEAQEKLKSKKVIYDDSEEPATRVALRNIKDFAIPFKFQEKILWKYAFTPQEEIDKILFPKEEEAEKEEEEIIKIEKEEEKSIKEDEIPKAWEVKKEEIKQAKEKSKKTEDIFDKKEEKEKSDKKKSAKTKKTFLEEVEEFLKTQDTIITTIKEVDKKKVTATAKSKEETFMVFAFNKNRIDETELLKCYKTANKENLKYQIITKSNLAKKLLEKINAYQKLIRTSKLED